MSITEIVLALMLLIQSVTGLSRVQSPELIQMAQVRSAEIVSTFGHRPLPELRDWHWGEVIGWNNGYDDPVVTIVNGWRNSSPHWGVLTDPFYAEIGCGLTVNLTRYYFVCIVGTQRTSNPPMTLPDTAMMKE